MKKPVEVARTRMTTLDAQRHLAFSDYVKLILGKTDEEKARFREELKHKNAAKALKNQRTFRQLNDKLE